MTTVTQYVEPTDVDDSVDEEVVVPRPIGRRTTDDLASAFGSAAAGIAWGWLIYSRIAPMNGWFPLTITSYVCAMVTYAVVSYVGGSWVVVKDRLMAALIATAAFIVMSVLGLIIGYVFWQARTALGHLNFFTTDLSRAGPLDPLTKGGVLHAMVGTLIMISIAIVLTVPLGIGCAVFLTEVGGRGSRLVRTVVTSMTALPSIVAGLFILVTVIIFLGIPRSGLAAALAISVMMLPIIARASEVVLSVVPNGLREASLALGAPQWQTVWRVVLPTARPGLTTAVILGVARGLGETSPVLLTAGYTTYLNVNPTQGPMVSLPLLTFALSRSPEKVDIARSFGGACVLLLLVLTLFAIARAIVGRGGEGKR